VEQQLAEAMEQLQGLGADMEKKREVSQRVKKLRKDIADRVRLRFITLVVRDCGPTLQQDSGHSASHMHHSSACSGALH
jgi:hypothetical protein